MPIYEYACQQCQHEFELLVRSDTVPACPLCGGHELEKCLSLFATTASGGPVEAATTACGTCGNPAGPGACRWP